jgi:DNA repair protein RecN (Recombination protein N)
MLLELKVKNFAIIKDVRVEFSKSFNVLTGETGAGKSLIIDALLALMGRGDSSFVRSGEDFAEIEAIFSIDDTQIEEQYELNGEDFICIKKIIQANGKSRQYINDSFVTQAKVKEILQRLLHVYGQSEAKELYDASYHSQLYDIYCNNVELKSQLRELINKARAIKKDLLAVLEDEQKRQQEIELLKYQIEEIEKANIVSSDEEIELQQKRLLLQNREKILRALSEVYNFIYSSEHSAYDLISKCVKILSNVSTDDNVIIKCEEELRNTLQVFKGLAENISNHINFLEFGDMDINAVEARLDLFSRLKRKYGETLEEVNKYAQKARARLEKLQNLEIEKADLEKALEEKRNEITRLCRAITEKREKHLLEFSKNIEKELKDLGMPKCVFHVELKKVEAKYPEDLSYNGMEYVEFYFASHKGEPPKPINMIASGGELSRIMLAIKNVIPKEKEMTVIFDEVDSGVGGKTGEMLGMKLKEISKHHQVICITHLPQVAVWADRHIKIEKDESGKRVMVNVNILDGEERLYEIARMLGGNVTEKGIEYAKELISKVKEV